LGSANTAAEDTDPGTRRLEAIRHKRPQVTTFVHFVLFVVRDPG